MEKTHKPKTPLLKNTLRYLKLSGLDPLMGNKFMLRDLWATLILISTIFMFTLMVIQVVTSWNGVTSVREASYLPGFTMAIIKHILFMWNRKKLMKMIGIFDQFWDSYKFGENVEKSIMKTYNRAYRYIKMFFCFIAFNCVMITLPVIISDKRRTMYANYLLCDLNNDPCFIAYTIWHFLGTVLICPASIGFDMLFVVFVTYAYAALEMVKVGIHKLNLDSKQNLNEVVEQHIVILQFIKQLNGFMAIFLMLQFSLSMWQLVVCWFMMTINGFPPDADSLSAYGVVACSLQMQLLIYSTGGGLIYDQTISVSDAAFNGVEWFLKEKISIRRDLCMIIQRSQKVSRLSVGFIYNLNLAFFMSTLRQSLSVFTLLRTISIKSGAIESFG